MHNTSTSVWRRWLEQHAGRLLLFARQQTRTEADAEDLLQEALVECWKRIGADDLPPLALVFATIRRRAIDRARRDQRRAQREAAGGADEPVWFDTAGSDAETRELVTAALQKLPEIHREVVTLKIWGELTFAEIAAALEIPANTAASRYRYGLELLRKELQTEGLTQKAKE